MESLNKRRVVVAGGGTAGWMAAMALSRQMPELLDITLIESEEIGTVGVGEAGIPPMQAFHRLMGIDEKEFVRASEATFKLGIQFENWGQQGDKYIHSFGKKGKDTWMAEFLHFWMRGAELGIAGGFGEYCVEWLAATEKRFGHHPDIEMNYSYHFDAAGYARFLRKICEEAGVRRIEGRINRVTQYPDTGFIQSLVMQSGEAVEGDLFIDCTGFRGLLIEQTLHTGYEDWSNWLINDRAAAVQTSSVKPADPYVRCVAHDRGWRWCIPLQSRVGNGTVYSSYHMSDDEAIAKLLADVDGEAITEPKIIRFRTGRRRQCWNKNVIALGLSSGFIEPLESTSIHLVMTGVNRLMHMFPFGDIDSAVVDEYNRQSRLEIERIRDFVLSHYKITTRDDSAYWRYCRNMQVPETLAQKIALFKSMGKIYLHDRELFNAESWAQVMLGQGLMPDNYHQFARLMKEQDLKQLLQELSLSVRNKVNLLPEHQTFIKQYSKV